LHFLENDAVRVHVMSQLSECSFISGSENHFRESYGESISNILWIQVKAHIC